MLTSENRGGALGDEIKRHVRGRYGESTRPWGKGPHGKPDVKLLGVFDNENVIVRLKKKLK